MNPTDKTPEFGYDAKKAKIDMIDKAATEAEQVNESLNADAPQKKKGLLNFNSTSKGAMYAGAGVVALALLGGGLMLINNKTLPSEVTGAKLVPTSPEALKESPMTAGVEEYKNTANVAEINRGLEAEEAGASSIPAAGTNEFNREAIAAVGTASGTETPPDIPKAVSPATTGATPAANSATPVVQRQPVDPQITALIQAMATAKTTVPSSSTVKYAYQKDYVAALTAKVSADSEAKTSGLLTNSLDSVTLASAGETAAANLDMAINTDSVGPVKATILNGPLKGGILLGTVTRNGYTAQASFTTLSFPGKGVTIPINAVNFDVETGAVGNADSVNRHLIVRYAVKPLMAALVGIGQAYVKAQQTTSISTIDSGNTSLTTSGTGTVSGKAATAIGVGALADQIRSDSALLGIAPTVKVNMGATIGIIFMSDVVYSPNKVAANMAATK